MQTGAAPFGITVCGIEELDGHGRTGASHVLSILDPDHPVPEAFGSFGEHVKLELRFHDIIEDTPGQILPQTAHVDAILELGRNLQAEPQAGAQAGPQAVAGAGAARHLLVHCHAGISRSTAAMALILAQALPERTPESILNLVHGIREKAWPNLRIIEIGDARLGLGGALVTATHALHRLQIDRRPNLVAFMQEGGRGREIAAARRHEPLPAA